MNSGRIAEGLGSMSRTLIWSMHAIIFALAGVCAFFLRFDLRLPHDETAHLLWAVPIWIAVKSVVFRVARLDRGWWRFVSLHDLPRLALANLLGSFLGTIAIRFIAPPGFPRSVYVLDLLVCSLMTVGARLAVRILFEASRFQASAGKKCTLIYGAGRAGMSLLAEIRNNASLPYDVVGFIDDNPNKADLVTHKLRVLGDGEKLGTTARKYQVDTVLIAIPSATGEQMTRILRNCREAGVSYQTVPGLGEIIETNHLSKQIRDVAVEDLLGRNPVRLDEMEISGKLSGRVILVTGAGGSIGSELCRQIARFSPQTIVGYEISENALFHLDLEMKERFPLVNFRPEIGSIQMPDRLAEVFSQYQPSILYHAAAYKHVPMMETHIFEALQNNVFGTYQTALVAAEHRLEDFVMISTDKAVHPTSVMGVTKRVAELAVNSLQNRGTRFVSVRFGNVLGSNGSVVPRFKKQIAMGGPVTVTHPDMERYFMSIPEASQLVLQASTMGRGGETFVLDMGKPVKIVDLARNLILLSGLRPDEDIQIEFSGIRPGEKLYEELHTFGESTLPTQHEKIKIFMGPSLGLDEMREFLERLRHTCALRAVAELILQLKEIVPEYNPSSHVLRRALAEQGPRDAKRPLSLAAAGISSASEAAQLPMH
jgi:FlaA1/EpsC-like NDP-sugar epimerase